MNRGNRYWWALAAAIAVTPAMAQEQDDSPLEEVVVTAQFREENLQDTPLAITAVNAAMLEQRSQYSIYEVAAQAPNVTLTPGGIERGSSMIAFIRGVGQTDFNYAVEPGVGIYVDDIYFATLTGSLLDLLDLDRVEISRGPQGTLAGRNSIGGAIKLYSVQPGPDEGGRLQATFGDYDRVDIRGSAGFTIVEDKLYARIAGASRSRDGYVKRLDYGCVHPESGIPTYNTGHVESCELGTEGGISYTAARGQLRWLASDAVAVTFSGDMVNDASEPAPTTLRRVNAGVNNPNPPVGVGSANGNFVNGTGEGLFFDIDGDRNTTNDRVYYDNRFVTHGPFRGDTIINDPYVTYTTYLDPNSPLPTRPFSPVAVPPINEIDHYGGSLTIDWAVNENFSLKSITAYREYTADWAQDADGSPLNSQMLLQHLEHDQFSQELRLNGQLGEAIDFTLGGFYFEQDGTLEANVNLAYVPLIFIHGPDPTPSDSQALFAHAVWHVTDRLNLSAGVRYTEDHKEYTYFRRNPDGTLPEFCFANPALPFDINNPPNCALFDGVAGQPLFDISAEFDSEQTDYRVALDYHFTDDFMVYGQVATGYKGGGVNPRPFFIVQIETFEPEEMETYEVGFKTTIADRVRLNVAAFYNDYTNIVMEQLACELPFPPFFGSPCLQPGNVGSAEVKGAELEAEIRFAGGFSFDASVSYIDFEYQDINPATGVTLDMTTPYTPEMKWSTGLQYKWEVGNGSSFIARADVIYQDEMFTEGINADTNLIEDYTLTNARLTWRSPEDVWEASFEATNVTDEVYFLSMFRDQFGIAGIPGTSGTSAGAIGPPRMFAFTLTRNF
jgi:iron complex outermembrane receptor protein